MSTLYAEMFTHSVVGMTRKFVQPSYCDDIVNDINLPTLLQNQFVNVSTGVTDYFIDHAVSCSGAAVSPTVGVDFFAVLPPFLTYTITPT